MKKIFLLILLVGIHALSFAQSRIASVEYQKVLRDAVVVEIPFAEKLVKAALQDSLQKLGYRPKESKGYLIYKAVVLSDLGTQPLDLYFEIDRKSRKEKESSTITLILSREFDSFMSISTDAAAFEGARKFLDNIRAMVASYDLNEQIISQLELVKKNEKKLASLVEEEAALEKKKLKLEEELAENRNNQAAQTTNLDIEKQVLETLKGKRKL